MIAFRKAWDRMPHTIHTSTTALTWSQASPEAARRRFQKVRAAPHVAETETVRWRK